MSAKRYVLSATFVVLLILASAAVRSELRPPVPEISCVGTATSSSGTPFTLLVVGESWAAGGRLFPALPAALARRLNGRPVRVCSAGFSGKNTMKIVRGVEHELDSSRVSQLFGGHAPHSVVVLNGVNDQMQHIGASRYAEETARLRNLFTGSHVQVVSVPKIRFADSSLPLTLRLKSRAQRFFFDHGQSDPRSGYEQALRSMHPEVSAIAYDAFMPTYDDSLYQPDGIHLTRVGFQRYGSFIGNHLDLDNLGDLGDLDGANTPFATGATRD